MEIPPNHEFEFNVSFEDKITIKLIDGVAELFGTELASGREYEFQGQHSAIFTYHGCTLEFEGECEHQIKPNKSMLKIANIYFALQNMRRTNQQPRVLILGNNKTGKTTLSKILTSYSAKMNEFPMLVNLDPEMPVLSPPGALTAAPISHIYDLENGFGMSAINGPSQTHHKQPIVYNYGLHNIKTSLFYQNQIKLLANGVNSRILKDTKVSHAGLIVDTPSSILQDLDILKLVCKLFEINIILTMGPLNDLEVACSRYEVPLINAVDLSDQFIRQTQRKFIMQYFFGNSSINLSPFTVQISLNDLVVYRPCEVSEDSKNLLTKVEPSSVLQNCLLAVVNAEKDAPVDVVERAECLGYVHVVEADDKRGVLKILLPVPGRVPERAYIMGEFRYAE